MNPVTITIIGLGLTTYLLKSAGPLIIGGRPLPSGLGRFAETVPAPLLAALVLTATVASGQGFVFDARLAGLAAAGIALRLKAPFAVVILVAAAATAAIRALW